MRKSSWGAVAVLLLASTALGRTWTSDKGVTIDADYVGHKDGKILLLVKSTGKIAKLAPEQLSAEDQKYAAELEKNPPTDALNKKLAEDATNPQSLVARGRSRLNNGKPEEAISDFNAAIALKPKEPTIAADAYDGRGLANKKLGDAAKAHDDFTKATEVDPKFAWAYRHRAENLLDYIKTPEGKPVFEKAKLEYDKNRDHMAKASFDHAPWQPVHSTKGKEPSDAAMKPMMQADMALFRQYDTPIGNTGGTGGWGGGGYGGGGVVIGGPGVVGPVVVAPGINAPLGVYPPIVDQGEKVTLQANPAELAKGMPSMAKTGAKGPGGKAPANVDAVDFYRDSNGDGKFTPGQDQYLGSDKDSKDGYSLEVSTAGFPLGNLAYFAVPKNSAAADNSLPLAANLLTALAEAEAKIAKEAASAANGAGLSAEKADALAKEQAQITSKIGSIVNDIKQAAPEVAKLLADTRAPLSKANGALGKAKKSPNEESIGSATEAGSNADVAAKQLALAAEKLTKAASGDEPPKPGSPGTGRPAAANGLINAPKGAPGGPGGPGGPGKGGYGGDREKGGTDVVDDDELRRRYDLDDGDIVTDDDRLRVRDRASRLVEERDYDRAVLDYDRLLVDEPENLYYLRNRAHTYLQRGGYDDAIADYNQLITLDTENADFYYNRGCAFLAAGKLDSAIADFTKSVELNETGHLAFNNRGITYARQGQFEKAVADFTKALNLEPKDQLAYHNRGLANSKLGKTAEAEADFAKAKALGEGG